MTVDYQRIYDEHAATYDRLVSAEDHEGNLLRAVAGLVPLRGASVLEVGVGTGRVARQLLGAGCARLVGVDPARAMLEVARGRLAALELGAARPAIELVEADGRSLPVASGWADLAVAAWVFGHFRSWLPGGWREGVGAALSEMRRALRPGGVLVLVETLGTGRAEPAPPDEGLAEYFAWLEREQGLARTWLRTDYRFASRAEAESLVAFFFGEAMLARLPAEGAPGGGVVLPECTGLWWSRAAGGGAP
ncbi:MAG TPA: class I SAM-dependent methyltransferase [Polyangiaceae bacterium]|nr:class I SAM-dependent methyltransferase [Polyangiaceae bacterium]